MRFQELWSRFPFGCQSLVRFNISNSYLQVWCSPCFEEQDAQKGWAYNSVYALDELLLHHTVEGDVGQVRDEGVTGPSADALTASEVQQSQRGETLQVGQTAICQLTATWRQTDRIRLVSALSALCTLVSPPKIVYELKEASLCNTTDQPQVEWMSLYFQQTERFQESHCPSLSIIHINNISRVVFNHELQYLDQVVHKK